MRLSNEESISNGVYNKAILEPIDNRAFLLEAGQGKNTNGNVFALIKAIRGDERFDDYSVCFSLVPEKYDEARIKIENYGLRNVRIVERESHEYRKLLATSKFLVTDNSFPAYFYKRPEQVYLNTWHGTPIKALGRTDLSNAVSIGNIQANMVKADILLHPNSFTKGKMMDEYMVENYYGGKTLVLDYPRNDALYRKDHEDEIREKYGLEGKRLIAYMPTWRGVGREINVEEEIEKNREIVSRIRSTLREDEVLFVNLHFLIGSAVEDGEYDDVFPFPMEYETYDFLSACDTLITDYSSVAIDFGCAGKKVVLYTYDYDSYKRDRGFYIDVKDLPFEKATTPEELDEVLHSDVYEYELDPSLIPGSRGDSSEKTLDMLCFGREDGLEIEDYSNREKYGSIAYIDDINRKEHREMLREFVDGLDDETMNETAIMFPNVMSPETIDTLKGLRQGTDFIKVSVRFYCTNREFRILRLAGKYGLFRTQASRIYRREAMRNIGQFRSSGFECIWIKNKDRIRMLGEVDK